MALPYSHNSGNYWKNVPIPTMAPKTTRVTSILLVGEGHSVPSALGERCAELGYDLCPADEGLEGLRAFFERRPSLVITEVHMPRMNGLELVSRIREVSAIPIIVLTEVTDERTIVQALRMGADDYIVKPVGNQELLARVEACLRRARLPSVDADEIYSDGLLTIDFDRQEAFLRDSKIELTPTELDILVFLSRRAGKTVSVLELLNGVWGSAHFSEDIVKWHMGNLRKKLGKYLPMSNLITTVWGTGYRYDRPAPVLVDSRDAPAVREPAILSSI